MKINRNTISVLVLLIAIAAIGVFGAYPLYSSLAEQNETLHNEKVELAKQKQQSSDLVQVTREYQEIQENASRLDEAFVKKDTISILKFIEQIETLSASLGLEEQVTVSPLPSSPEDAITSSTVQYSASGSYTNIYRFLEALHQQPFYLSIHDLSLEQNVTTGAPYVLTFTGTIFWK